MAFSPLLNKEDQKEKGGIKMGYERVNPSTSEFVVIEEKSKSEPEDISVNNRLMRSVGRNVASKKNLFEWQFCLVDWKHGDGDNAHYSQFYQSADGAGESCVPGKMETLMNHNIANTGEMSARSEELDHTKGEVGWYGGIAVPYSGHEGADSKPVYGVVMLAFSGAHEAIDLTIVLEVLRDYIVACDDCFPEANYVFDFSGLMEDQLSAYLWEKIGK